jgi:hypothetical protein
MRPERPVQPAFLRERDQKRIENARPAKKVDAARAGCPARKPKMAEAVDTMITTMATMTKGWRAPGEGMAGR